MATYGKGISIQSTGSYSGTSTGTKLTVPADCYADVSILYASAASALTVGGATISGALASLNNAVTVRLHAGGTVVVNSGTVAVTWVVYANT